MTWVTTIANGIEKAFSFVRPPLAEIPTLLMLCSMLKRPGLSAIALTSAIIQRLPEAGINTDVNEDGSQNKILSFVRIIAEELVNEIKENARVDVAITPGSVVSLGTGANAGGPVTVISYNTLASVIKGVVR